MVNEMRMSYDLLSRFSTNGFVFKILNLLIYSFASVILKLLTNQGIHIFQIMFLCAVFGFIGMMCIIKIGNLKSDQNTSVNYNFRVRDFDKLYFIRCIFSVFGLFAWISALKSMYVSDATAISYITPLVAIAFAVLLLKERLTLMIIFAMTLGMIGMFIIINPVLSGGSGIFMAVLSAIMWGMHDVVVKHQTSSDHWIKQSYYTFGGIACIMLPFAVLEWKSLEIKQMFTIMTVACLFIANKACLIKAFSKLSLVALAPISFLRLIFSSVLAYLFFQEGVALSAVVGSIFIVLATVLTMTHQKNQANSSVAIPR